MTQAMMARALLSAERTALNLLGRLCGIATLTRRYVEAVEGAAVILERAGRHGRPVRLLVDGRHPSPPATCR